MKTKYIYPILAALLLAVVAFFFFFPDAQQGNVLQQADTLQGMANGREGQEFYEKTGETTRWTNSLFSGMPNFQISPSYPANKVLSGFAKVYSLWLPAPSNLLFIMMLGFFIMCLCLKFRWYTSLFASIAWGFSTYFIIIIGAGHIWKFLALAYVPPTIGGIALCYRGKYIAGTALASLFGALQLQSNHPQMTYYFCFVIFFLVLAWLWNAIRDNGLRRWAVATCCCFIAGAFAVGANSANLYNSWEYSKETIRGKATDLTVAGKEPSSGLDKDYITTWSYGIDESMSLLIPNVKGGATLKPIAGENVILSAGQTAKAQELPLTQQERMFMNQFPQYFGDQPMTNGPVYVGAFIFVLAILALFVVEGAVKWALFAVSILALGLSWGHNFNPLTDLFIDYFPGYNRFRTVSSILVILEFTIPILATLCLRKMINTEGFFEKFRWTFYSIFGIFAFICFLGWVSPGIFGSPFSANETDQLTQMGIFTAPEYTRLINAISESRLSLVSADSFRSLIFIIIAFIIIMLWFKGILKKAPVFIGCLTLLAVIDLYPLNKRYVNSENFTPEVSNNKVFAKTAADEEILKDTTNYRVLDVDGFDQARSSYFHKTIGGYHAAKLTRYNDLITRQISKGNPNVLNMLNAKYILSGNQYQLNPEALGNAWLVSGIDYVKTPDEEMNALDSLNTGRYAVADVMFESVLGRPTPPAPGDTIYETSYAPNRLRYQSHTSKDNVAVFSEVYFPWGWTATVDGEKVPIGRVDYVLRAIQLPAGKHTVEFVFDPESLKTTNALAIVSICLIGIICLASLTLWGMHAFGNGGPSFFRRIK
ncbi:MAG: YfhO family protein [Muribaculaceae bacterium]|nr:YfhO family protein [Muribaculaceae bacterium]